MANSRQLSFDLLPGALVGRPGTPQARHRLIPSSFQSTPAPAAALGTAMPRSIRNGSATIMLH